MRIGIDVRCLCLREMTGVSRYVLEIIKRWMTEFTQHEYYLFACAPLRIPYTLPKNWHIVGVKRLIREGRLWGAFTLPRLIRKHQLDVFWGGNYTLPVNVNRVRYYVNVYDLALLKFEGIGESRSTRIWSWRVKASCERAHAVITTSESSANDIEDLFHIPKEKIKVIYPGGIPRDAASQPDIGDTEISEKEKIKKPFFLFIGTIEPRKNVPTIICAFEEYIDKNGTDDVLVLAGKPGWKPDAFRKAYASCKYKERIILTGYVTDAYKSWLLSHAVALLYPSLYEGFGMPILEAFDYDLPVITSGVSSMPEAGGDAAFYLKDPCDSRQLAELMEKVRFMAPDERQNLHDLSVAQRSRFSWETCAREMMQVLEGG